MPIYGGDPTNLSGGLSDEDVLALQALLGGVNNARIEGDGTLQLLNTDSGLFHTPSVSGGVPSLDLSDPGDT